MISLSYHFSSSFPRFISNRFVKTDIPARIFRMKLRIPAVLPLLAALGVLSSAFAPAALAQNSSSAGRNSAVAARLQKDVAALTRFPSRVPGTPGNIAAAQYMAARFKQIGLADVRQEEYDVTVPVTKNA